MTPHLDSALPKDLAALVAMILALRGELAEERAARRAAELGLQTKTPRRSGCGRRSRACGMSGSVGRRSALLGKSSSWSCGSTAAGGTEDAQDDSVTAKVAEKKARRRGRKPLPESLPRRDVECLHAEGCTSRAFGVALRKVGEDVTEILEHRPGRFEVVRHVRPAFSCRACETMMQAPMPSLSIKRSRPGLGLLAHVLVSKYCDHIPLYRL